MKKTKLFILTLLAVALSISVTGSAQNVLDSLFFRDGRVAGVIVSRSTSEMVQFSYPNETLQNEIQKSELLKIRYASGRVEQLSVIEDALPIPEPEFVGEAYFVKGNNESVLLDKEVAQNKFGRNEYSHNKYKIKGREANLQVDNTGTLSFIVRANDNESVPMSIITIYKFTRSGTKRKVTVGRHGVGLSETVKKFEMPFTAEKYGKSSYFLTATNYSNGEYGITVNNPSNVDEKKRIFNCIGVGNHQSNQLKSDPDNPRQHRLIWYQGEVNVGGAFGEDVYYSSGHTRRDAEIGASLSTVHGIRISKYGYVGVGAEFMPVDNKSNGDYPLVVFSNFRGYLPINDKLETYASISYGGDVLSYTGGYCEMGIGLNYGHLNVMAGYQGLKFCAFILKVGVRF